MKAFIASLVNGGATKFLTAILGAGVQAVIEGGHFDWRVFAAGMATALGVYLFPNSNKPAAP